MDYNKIIHDRVDSYLLNEMNSEDKAQFEQDLLFNKDLQSKEIKMPDCYTTQVINKIIDSF